MTALDDFRSDFGEDPGYLDFARFGPVSAVVLAEERAHADMLSRARFGSLTALPEQDARARAALGQLLALRPDQVALQPSASQALMHVMFGLTGGVAAAATEFPAVGYAMARASEALGVLVPHELIPDHERVTPGVVRDQVTSSVVAVVVSLVDYATGQLVDLEGIRQVIGDRLLIVDATQGAGIVDAPWPVADVVVGSGQTWLRAGLGTGYLALNDRAREQLTPVWSGWMAQDSLEPVHEILPPPEGAAAFRVGHGDPTAHARLAATVERVLTLGVGSLAPIVLERTARLLELADEVGLAVVSPRDDAERAGIVVVEPHPDHFGVLAAALHNHGITATSRSGRVRLSAHVSTSDETLGLLRTALLTYRAAIRP